jgi:hypothetical protein
MLNRKTAAGMCYAITAAASLFMGLLYLMSPEFMPYHSAAIGQNWHSVEPGLKVLLLALLRVAGGGFLSLSIVITVLLYWPWRDDARWAQWLLLLAILAVHGPTLWATLSVTLQTPASAPWAGPATAVAAAIAGFTLDSSRRFS